MSSSVRTLRVGAIVSAVATICVVLWLLNAAVALPVGAYLLVAWALPRRVPLGIRFFMALPVVLVTIIALTLVLQMIGAGLNPPATWGPIAAAAAGSRAWRGRCASERSPLLWGGAVVCIAVFGFLIWNALPGTTSGCNEPCRMQIMATGYDGSAHQMIYNRILDHNGLTLFDRGEFNWDRYPPGFHLLAATVNRAVAHRTGKLWYSGQQFDIFWAAAMGSFSLLLGAFAALVASMSMRATGSPVLANGKALAAGLAAALTWTPSLLLSAFDSQVIGFALMAILLVTLLWEEVLGSRWVWILSALTLIAIGWTWFYGLPVAAPLLIWWWRRRWQPSKRAGRVREFGVLALVAAATLAPALVLMLALGSGSIASSAKFLATTTGGVEPIPLAIVASAVLAGGAAVMLRRRGMPALVFWAEISTLGASVVFAGVLDIFGRTPTGPGYAYYKMLYAVYLMGVACLVANVVPAAAALHWPVKQRLIASVGLVAAAGLLLGAPLAPSTTRMTELRTGAASYVGVGLTSNVLYNFNAWHGKLVLAYGGGAGVQPCLGGDAPVSDWLYAFAGGDTRMRQIQIEAATNAENPAAILQFVQRNVGHVRVVACTVPAAQQLRATFAAAHASRDLDLVSF